MNGMKVYSGNMLKEAELMNEYAEIRKSMPLGKKIVYIGAFLGAILADTYLSNNMIPNKIDAYPVEEMKEKPATVVLYATPEGWKTAEEIGK